MPKYIFIGKSISYALSCGHVAFKEGEEATDEQYKACPPGLKAAKFKIELTEAEKKAKKEAKNK